MSKRKSPAERRIWARMSGHEWEIHLTDGQVLRPVRDLLEAETSELARRLPVYRLSYLEPVVDLSGDGKALAAELARPCSVTLFRGDRGTEAVVVEHLH